MNNNNIKNKNDFTNYDYRITNLTTNSYVIQYNHIQLFLIIFTIINIIIIPIVFKDQLINTIDDSINWLSSKEYISYPIISSAIIISPVIFLPIVYWFIASGIIFTKIYGIWIGWLISTLVSFFSVIIGYNICWYIGSHKCNKFIFNFAKNNRLFKCIMIAITEGQWKIIMLYRLSQGFPASIGSYAFSIAGVSFSDYNIGTIGELPNIIIFSFIGASIENLKEFNSYNDNTKVLITTFTIITIILSFIFLIYITKVSKKYYNLSLNENII